MRSIRNALRSSVAISLLLVSTASQKAQTLPRTPITLTYTIQFAGRGSARVTSTPAGIDCPGVCTYTWPRNAVQQLLLTATPDANTFTSLGCTGTAPHEAGKQTTCNMGQMLYGAVSLTVYLWPKGCPPPGPQPTAIVPTGSQIPVGNSAFCGTGSSSVSYGAVAQESIAAIRNQANAQSKLVSGWGAALAMYQMAAALGDSEAENGLGYMYQHVQGDAQNAMYWYQKAAAQGNADARNNIVSMQQPSQPAVAAQPTPTPVATPAATTADTIVPGLNCVTTYVRNTYSLVVHNGCGQLITLAVRGANGAYFQGGIGADEDVPQTYPAISTPGNAPPEDLKFFACPGNSWIQESSSIPTVTYNTQHYECKVLQ